jgi:hypothetical protein
VTSNLYGSMDLDSMNLKTEYGEKSTEEYCKNLLVAALTLKAFDVEKEVPTTSSPVQRADVVAYPRIPLPKWDWGYLVFEIKRGGLKIRNEVGQQMHSYANALFRNESGATFSPTAVILFPCRHNLELGPNFGNAFFDGGTLQVFVNGHLILKQRDMSGNMDVLKKAKDVIKQHKTESTAKPVKQPQQPITKKSLATPNTTVGDYQEPQQELPPDLVAVRDAARRLGISRQALDKKLAARGVEPEKWLVGGRRLVFLRKETVEALRVPKALKLPSHVADYSAKMVTIRDAAAAAGVSRQAMSTRCERAGIPIEHVSQNGRTHAAIRRDLADAVAAPQKDAASAIDELRQFITERNKVVDGWAIEFSRRLARLEGSK